MDGLLECYEKQAQRVLSPKAWLAKIQTQALAHLNHQGFPKRHEEEWKYTHTDELLKKSFDLPGTASKSPLPCKTSEVPARHQVLIHNGAISIDQSSLPSGVLILPLATALKEQEPLIKPYLGSILKQEHGFHYLNTAMIQCGVFIYIPKGLCIEEPIALTHIQDQGDQAVYLRHVILAEAQSQATVIETYQGGADCCYFTNCITEIHMAKATQLTHYKIQNESKFAYHLGHVAVRQAALSQFNSHSLSLGAALARSDLDLDLKGEGAHCLLNGMYAPSEGQHVDHHTKVQHLVPSCSSEQDYKGILSGHSQAVFNGKVVVAKDAQHTNAKQQNKNLLLSAHAEVNTKPQLEIFADDVQCTHGATVGQLDEEALFYLATRGISKSEAAHYLIQAFTLDNLQYIPHPELAGWMSHLLMLQLGQAHGY